LDCQKRVVAAFHEYIAPAMFDEEDLPTPPEHRAVVVVAHSNTIRSLMAAFDEVPDELVPKLYVPNSVPILYRFNHVTRKPVSTKLQSSAGGSHARWILSAENHREVRKGEYGNPTLLRFGR
jgi:bisphosphoglycerate-dependent phosphoglycerate mutase